MRLVFAFELLSVRFSMQTIDLFICSFDSKDFEYDDVVYRVQLSGKLWRYKGVINAGHDSVTALHRDLNATYCFIQIIAGRISSFRLGLPLR